MILLSYIGKYEIYFNLIKRLIIKFMNKSDRIRHKHWFKSNLTRYWPVQQLKMNKHWPVSDAEESNNHKKNVNIWNMVNQWTTFFNGGTLAYKSCVTCCLSIIANGKIHICWSCAGFWVNLKQTFLLLYWLEKKKYHWPWFMAIERCKTQHAKKIADNNLYRFSKFYRVTFMVNLLT